ncbi:MAG TPA: hypothetical protein VKB75_12490 [Jatrophihabitans sp.]|nr:hypothetical protein [Jatrophihabitans sp.]
MDEGLVPVRTLLGDVRLEAVERLGENDRALVDRVRATYPDGRRVSLIAKQYRSAGEGWVRESCALSILSNRLRAPRVVACAAEPPILVLEDLGDGQSVADALIGRDAEVAQRALDAWAAAIAALHVATRGAREAFHAVLAERQGDLPVADSRMPAEIDAAVRALDRECGALGVRVPAGALDELRGLTKRLGGSRLAALTPGDTCPDNNVLTAEGLVLVDFEGAEWRHVAWDVGYLHVPWPSCWCSWRIPEAAAEQAMASYLRAARPQLPEVDDPGFAADVEAAVVGWCLITTTWFISNALADDPPLNPDRPTPTRRAMISHRLQRAARSTELPALAELAAELAAELRRRWGDVALAPAPAFRAAQ